MNQKKSIQQKSYKHLFILFIIILIFTLTIISSSSAANTIYVNNNTGNDSWTGNSSTHVDGTDIGPKATIQNGTNTVESNGLVYVADGTYNEHITIYQSLTIIGQSRNRTIINGTNTGTPLTINSGLNVTLINFTITNGSSTTNGGAVNNQGNLTVNNCTFIQNHAIWGGAIANQGNLTVNNSTFSNNQASIDGGAIWNVINGGSLNCTINHSIFSNNQANFGAAVMNYNLGSLICTINQSTFSNNHVYYSGGAIRNYNFPGRFMNCTITQSTFSNNHADINGGAIHNYNDGSLISNVNFNRFYNNTANNLGNVIYNNRASLNVENNWWGVNNPDTDWTEFLFGATIPTRWVILSVNATPNNINNTQTSNIIADFNHINGGGDLMGGYIPDGPITLSIPWGSFTSPGINHSYKANTVDGVLKVIFYANEGAVNSLNNPVKVTATADNYTTNSTESAYIALNKTSDLYIKITTSNKNPKTGEIFTLTYKLGNNGPDNATTVTIIIPLPSGFIVSHIRGNGNWTYNNMTNTVTWTLANVPVGDPYLYISGRLNHRGIYRFSSSISSATYNLDTEGVAPLTITTVNEVEAATKTTTNTTETVGMQKTGVPIFTIILAILLVLGGFTGARKKQ